jgi:hypothetical protein
MRARCSRRAPTSASRSTATPTGSILIDERGQVIDGDQIMALIAGAGRPRAGWPGGALVATVMSNLGLERYLAGLGLGLVRTKVGDRYVVEAMREGGYNLGGEQSGHIVLTDYTTTGDGLIAACRCWRRWSRRAGRRASGSRGCSSRCRSVCGTSVGPRRRAARRTRRSRRCDRRRPRRGWGRRPAGDPQVGHRAADPGDGRGRHGVPDLLRGCAVRPFFARPGDHRAGGAAFTATSARSAPSSCRCWWRCWRGR